MESDFSKGLIFLLSCLLGFLLESHAFFMVPSLPSGIFVIYTKFLPKFLGWQASMRHRLLATSIPQQGYLIDSLYLLYA